ncbi:MAG: hypothetical protein ACOVNU_04265 [Candidatus Kapaibacteriota bacterium]
MPITQDKALTPDKKQMLVDELEAEIRKIGVAIKEKKYGTAIFGVIQQKQVELQTLLNKFLEKKGIITPSETNSALDVLNSAKRARLEQDYYGGIKKTTWYLIGIGVIGIGAYFLIKKGK